MRQQLPYEWLYAAALDGLGVNPGTVGGLWVGPKFCGWVGQIRGWVVGGLWVGRLNPDSIHRIVNGNHKGSFAQSKN